MTIVNTDNIIDLRDVTERYEELEGMDERDEEDQTEFEQLKELLDDLRGNGGDHQWNGNWYPLMLILDSHFEEYAKELAEDVGAINRDLSWPYTCIDWEKAAKDLQMDYSTVEFDGETYWYR